MAYKANRTSTRHGHLIGAVPARSEKKLWLILQQGCTPCSIGVFTLHPLSLRDFQDSLPKATHFYMTLGISRYLSASLSFCVFEPVRTLSLLGQQVQFANWDTMGYRRKLFPVPRWPSSFFSLTLAVLPSLRTYLVLQWSPQVIRWFNQNILDHMKWLPQSVHGYWSGWGIAPTHRVRMCLLQMYHMCIARVWHIIDTHSVPHSFHKYSMCCISCIYILYCCKIYIYV